AFLLEGDANFSQPWGSVLPEQQYSPLDDFCESSAAPCCMDISENHAKPRPQSHTTTTRFGAPGRESRCPGFVTDLRSEAAADSQAPIDFGRRCQASRLCLRCRF